MKLRSTETYWLLKNGLIHTYPSLQKDLNCDVLVIGSGITGALMAYQFSMEGYNTVLIDKRDIAMGSTAATTAMLQYEIDEPLVKLIDIVGERAAVDSYRGGVQAIQEIEKLITKIKAKCGFGNKQSLYVAASKNDEQWLHEEYQCRKKFDFEVSWLTRIQLQKNFGIRGEGAILSKVGASLDAYCFTHALLLHSVRHYKLRVFDHTEAESVVHGSPFNLVRTDGRRSIKCKHIVYAIGYESQTMLGKKVVNLNSTYAFVSEPVDELPTHLKETIFWNTEQPYLYMRVTPDDRILVGGGDEKFKNALLRDSLINQKEDVLMRSFQKFLPGMPLVPDFTWAGTFGVTKDSLPFIGTHPDFQNGYFALGFGGNGITFSVMAMDILSDALRGRPNKFLDYFRFDRWK